MISPRDPAFKGLVVLVGLPVLGFVTILVTWIGASRLTALAAQVPWLVSGGLTGLGLIGLGGACVPVYLRRHNAAVELRDLEQAVDHARHIAALLAARLTSGGAT